MYDQTQGSGGVFSLLYSINIIWTSVFFSNLSSRWRIGNHLNINLHVRHDKRAFLESCSVKFTYMISISKCDNLRVFFSQKNPLYPS